MPFVIFSIFQIKKLNFHNSNPQSKQFLWQALLLAPVINSVLKFHWLNGMIYLIVTKIYKHNLSILGQFFGIIRKNYGKFQKAFWVKF